MGEIFIIQMIFVFVGSAMVIAINPMELIKMRNSEIICIRDIEMEVTGKRRRKDDDGPDSYYVYLANIENPDKKAMFHGRAKYNSCKKGEIYIMQEVVYKNGDEILSRIKYATDTDYDKFQQYKNANPVTSEYYNDVIEMQIDSYHSEKNNKQNVISIIMFLFFFIIMCSMYSIVFN